MADTPFFNIKQVRGLLGVSERTVFRHIEDGDLKGFKVGREWRFTQEDIDTFVELQRKKAEEETQRKRQKEQMEDAA